jgi:hypothetical protein
MKIINGRDAELSSMSKLDINSNMAIEYEEDRERNKKYNLRYGRGEKNEKD